MLASRGDLIEEMYKSVRFYYRRINIKFLTAISLLLMTFVSHAHESRPAYLELKEQTNNVFDVQWRRPARGDMVLRMQPVFPAHCVSSNQVASYIIQGASIERWQIDCGDKDLTDQTITIDGLKETITDVLVRVEMINGAVYSKIIKGNDPGLKIEGQPSAWKVIQDYFVLGVGHILGGIDHLLFVLCLLLIVNGTWLLVKTITAFTIAHSITLGMATLGFVNVAQAPVEAVIALSILFLAAELMRQQRGERDLAMQAPWLVAFIFGLLHGFGFAGALSEVGLPQTEIPLALLMFNVGVEIGQLVFILVVMVVLKLSGYILKSPQSWTKPATTYIIGGISAFWLIERINGFW
jgi:hydrogenase/urease accessory protein HupE